MSIRLPTAHDKDFFDIEDFENRIINAYNDGSASDSLSADSVHARSIIAAGSGRYRDFSYIAPEIPEFISESCVGCMDCVTMCPDTAILGKVVDEETLNTHLNILPQSEQEEMNTLWPKTRKYWDNREKKGQKPGRFGIFIDPSKCKGCSECVEVCGDKNALAMVGKEKYGMEHHRKLWEFYQALGPTDHDFINERSLMDMMLAEESLLYVGGAGSCAGCGEATALRMMAAATGFVFGKENFGIVNSTGCSTVYGSTYPFNPWDIPWTNSLFENGATDAMGVRARWNQLGWQNKKLWVVGGDGAMLDIGFGSLSRLLASGMDVNVLILDTQVYSNTGGQASTATFTGQDAKFSAHGKVIHGKTERRKEIGAIAAMHPDVYVAQTVTSLPNHFYKSIMEANEFDGPSVISVYTTCQPEHGVGDDAANRQARLAVDTRAFPIFVFDPRKGPRMQDKWSLKGNPSPNKDWHRKKNDEGEFEEVRFRDFAVTEGRFRKQFKDGEPSEAIFSAESDRLAFWNRLQDLAGVERTILDGS
ncbi:MAG TPA: 4Fe-4S dicluster domain-containing protein [Candidatus Thalassarchaeaceae archaeon]|jgi:pyruvate/2-oxoacid:ferredoxin oxidoreductase beta subunit/Pyruvate/2-oxoacid:ferredoxin oxidoreductase delta subunit|nr:thiamine pyrophosphate-dependent enzyme [Candidatus Thalassarchaeaceae archaeon]DAC48634.1 MAG TPA: 4Fe-4S dicluster domain-containing protein [Candidatus Poseidoniales archaeon]HIH83597.1 4Fe-4S dicluster domain-containing protein [Candidatus Thalassarchaeaceae archaeon]|tara:strand:+ start:1065 stop:2663 length:1599 start_codon:yes stop_codon:yes gene_type:complete